MSSGLDRPVMAPGIGESFDTVVVPHLDAGYRLARWLMRDEHDADDVVQEASLRALRYFRTFDGGDGRAWFLRIVRKTCYGWRRRGSQAPADSFDEEQHSSARPPSDPETLLLQTDDAMLMARALGRLPGQTRSWCEPRGDSDPSAGDEAELREWILGGRPQRLQANPLARFFLDRQAMRMPAFRGRITEEELLALEAYIGWLRR